ncbi:hypothetical protein GF343_02710 [Candidatus Woesearchaeota archaeon]|nr:hypothetical protein [Candidatus Woesearchaeota archaeon]
MLDFLKFWKKKKPAAPSGADIAPPELPDFDAKPAGAEPNLAARPPGAGAGHDMAARPPGGSDFPRPAGGLAPEQSPGFRPREAPIEAPSPPGAAAEGAAKDFQLVNAKLDTIKAGIDHINARLDKLEKKEEKEIVAWR